MDNIKKPTRELKMEIFGEEYRIASELGPEATARVAEYVDAKMREVAGLAGTMSRERVAVLAAMEMAAELLQVQEEREHLLQKAYDSLDRLKGLVEQRSTLLPLTSEWLERRCRRDLF